MVFFSILYGIMLNSLFGLGAFPISHAWARVDVIKRVKGKPLYVEGTKSRQRFWLSLLLLNFAPFVYFGITFQCIGVIGDIPSTNFLYTILQIVFIGFLSLGVFAFYHFFLGFVTYYRNRFYTQYDLKRLMNKRAIHPRSRNHILAGFTYLIPLALLLKALGL